MDIIELYVKATTNEAEYERELRNLRAKIVDLRTSVKAAFATMPSVVKTAFQTSLQTIKNFGVTAGNFLKKAMLGAMLVLGLSLGRIIASLRESFNELVNIRGGKLASDIAAIQGHFTELRAAIVNAFLPLIELAVPYIRMALEWLVQLFNRVAMITAAFAGQKQVLQVVAGSAAKYAKNTKDAEKAAKGALAAFDQINVLQRDTAAQEAVTPKTVDTQIVPITDDILAKVKAIKDEIAKWITDPKGSFLDFIYWDNWVNFVKTKWQEFKDFIFLDNWKEFFARAWNRTKEFLISEWESLKQAWARTVEFVGNEWNTIKDFAVGIWDDFKVGAEIAWLVVTNAAEIAWAKIQEIWGNLKAWFAINVVEPLVTSLVQAFYVIRLRLNEAKEWFFSSLDAIAQKWQSVFTGVGEFVRSTINRIIDYINRMNESFVGGINATINAFNSISNIIPGFQPVQNITPTPIPRLATGAIVPPNSRFLAMLGDNTRENEILAPESKLLEMAEQIANKVAGNGGGTIENVIVLDGEVLFKSVKRVERNHGKNLLSGVAA